VNGNAVEFFLDRHIREERGGRTAFTDPTRTLTYAALHARAAGFATGLRRAGIGRERRLALLLLDTVDFPVAFWGALRAGVVPVPINTLLPAELLRYILADSRAEGLVVSAPLLPSLPPLLAGLPDLRLVVVANPDGSPPSAMEPGHRPFEAFVAEDDATPPVPASPDEVAFWLYSSATTGAPKGARHVHGSLRATADGYAAEVLGIGPEDVMFSVAKLFFAYGLGNSMTFPMAVGARAVLLPDRPTPAAVLATMRRYRPTLFAGVPTLYAALLADPALGPGAGSDRLRRCISAGEALPAAIGERWSATVGTDILDGIGSTEMLHIFITNRIGDSIAGTTGRPVTGYEARIVDQDMNELPAGSVGKLAVRGPTGCRYLADSRQTNYVRDGWNLTGDAFVRDQSGRFCFVARADDMIVSSGYNIAGPEVEAALLSHPAVAECGVVGAPDEARGMIVKAYIVLAANLTADDALVRDLQEHVKREIAPYKYPRAIEFVSQLPKTETGKLKRFALRQIAQAGHASAGMAAE
jgi:benzoate-CoA ligase family protein